MKICLARSEARNEMNSLDNEGQIEEPEGQVIFTVHKADLRQAVTHPSFVIVIALVTSEPVYPKELHLLEI
jgi:hypothetical protein